MKGKLVRNGQPYAVQEMEELIVLFAPAGAASENAPSFDAQVEPDGTFTVLGPKGNGIPPGQYRVEITSMPYQATSGEEDEEPVDKFKRKYSGEQSPLNVEITADNQEIVIDLAKGTVSKQG